MTDKEPKKGARLAFDEAVHAEKVAAEAQDVKQPLKFESRVVPDSSVPRLAVDVGALEAKRKAELAGRS